MLQNIKYIQQVILGLDNYSVAETGYQINPKLIATLDASELEFNPGYLLMQEEVVLGGVAHADNTVREIDEEYEIELVNKQNNNLYNHHTFFVTAVDEAGNESNFTTPVNLRDYKDSLPWRVDGIYTKNSSITEFPDTVEVESVDLKTVYKYPINFYKIEEPNEYSTYCDYSYEVVGTALKGIVQYKNEDKNFPEKHISNFKPKTSQMPQNTLDKIPQVNIDTFVDAEYSNANIDLKRTVKYPEEAKVKLDPGSVYLWVDRDQARRIIGKPDVNATDPREEFESFVADENPEYIVRREGATVIVEKVEKTEEEKITVTNSPILSSNVTGSEKTEQALDEAASNVEQNENIEKTVKEINNINYVEEQKKSTKKQVEEADKEKVKTTKYPIFANTAVQKYLALALINHEEKISLKAFPAYQNSNELFDDLFYIWYQNPYIMTIDIQNCSYYYNSQTLMVEYGVSEEKTKEYQEAVYNKSKEVVKEIIKENMTDYDKVIAIYDYLEDNARYNNAALEYAMSGNKDLYKVYPNSWNTYGILCEETGVCQSYAYAFNALAYESGLESVMVTGTMNNGGHAWNAVKINEKWYMVDATNNGTTSNLPYWVCNASTDFLASINFKFDDRFVDDGEENIAQYMNQDNSQDWYSVNNCYANSVKECALIWFRNRNQNDLVSIKYNINNQTDLYAFAKEFRTEASKLGVAINELNKLSYQAMGGVVVIRKI
ncbi:MAG: transglutaminase domain-containing protein [Clostridia bacterium]|nr:transglutaminase domain-containing protein [Clostridia bacterium]